MVETGKNKISDYLTAAASQRTNLCRRFFHFGAALLLLQSALAPLSSAAAAERLPGIQAVIRALQKDDQGSASAASPAARLLADIERYRREAAGMPPAGAAQSWFALYDRAVALGGGSAADTTEFDVDSGGPAGVSSMLSALPPPAAWSALRDEAQRRARAHPERYTDQALELLTEELLENRSGVKAALSAVDSAIQRLPPDARGEPAGNLVKVKSIDTRLNGVPADIADAVLRQIENAARLSGRGAWGARVNIPDLVTLVGAPRAEQILLVALSSPALVRVASGDATRRLARELALRHVAELKRPQWLLVDTVDAAELYEALRARFADSVPAPAKDRAAEGATTDDDGSGRLEADTYYFLFLVIKGRLPAAEQAFAALAAKQSLSIPRQAFQALELAHQNEALVSFLAAYLVRHPEARAWPVYIERASYTGHAVDALGNLDAVLARTDLPDYLRADLGRARIQALLALDRTDAALAGLQSLLQAPPSADERGLADRTNAALQLAGLGRVLKDPAAATAGLAFAESALKIARRSPSDAYSRPVALRGLIAELRKQGQGARAQAFLAGELLRFAEADVQAKQMASMGMTGVPSTRRYLLGELVGLYAEAGQFEDVRLLLTEVEGWGARDVRELLDDTDALDVRVALSAARALAGLGDPESARRIAERLIVEVPGYDPGYELFLQLEPHPLPWLEAQFRKDAFEERPLIWKAALLARTGDLAQAEKTVREAIAIDPSDGEEGPNDRLRAYSVLADILEARGDRAGAREPREAVAAIRLSEKADELHALGLYQRAFAGYGAALDHFADAYCIQSRLAVQLEQQGRRDEAAAHFRRAYELMPSSFGRIESHCFGCESVFRGPGPQQIATEVFGGLERREPRNPRVHYLLGYLLEEQGRYADALGEFRTATQLDDRYVNAWKHLAGLNQHVYVTAVDNEVATLKLMQLDPRQRHVQYDVSAVGRFQELWNLAERVQERSASAEPPPLFVLTRSAAAVDAAQAGLPPEIRLQVQQYQRMMSASQDSHRPAPPATVLGRHALVRSIGALLGADTRFYPE